MPISRALSLILCPQFVRGALDVTTVSERGAGDNNYCRVDAGETGSASFSWQGGNTPAEWGKNMKGGSVIVTNLICEGENVWSQDGLRARSLSDLLREHTPLVPQVVDMYTDEDTSFSKCKYSVILMSASLKAASNTRFIWRLCKEWSSMKVEGSTMPRAPLVKNMSKQAGSMERGRPVSGARSQYGALVTQV